jgi:hypothetical protein
VDHYEEAVRLIRAGNVTAGIAHALLALVVVFRDDEHGDAGSRMVFPPVEDNTL